MRKKQLKNTTFKIGIVLFLLLYFTPNVHAQYGYLIITADSLKPAFKDLALSKALKGYNTKIKSIEDIYTDYATYPDSVEKIKRYIYDIYTAMNTDSIYILLGGDESIVPIRKCYCVIRSEDGAYIHEKDYIPADSYYVGFRYNDIQFNWNNDSDMLFAEYIPRYDKIKHEWSYNNKDTAYVEPNPFTAIPIGRLPISNSMQIQNYCTKLYRYERGQFDDLDFYNRFLFAGKKVRVQYNNELSDSHHWADSLSSIITQYGYNANITMMFDTNTTNPSLSFTKENLQNTLQNVAYNFVNIDTHGDILGFVTENGDFTSAYLNSAFKNAAIITTPACQVCNFTNGLSIGQSFILNPNTANIAFLGNTDDGLNSGESNIPGASNKLIFDFYNKLFTPDYYNSINRRLGAALLASTREFNPYQNMQGRWVSFSKILFGDPEIYVYLKQPKHIMPLDATISNQMLNISYYNDTCDYYILWSNIYPVVDGCLDDYTNLMPHRIQNENGGVDIYGNFILGIYADGYVPYRSDVDGFKDVYIQKHNFIDEKIIADNIMIGRNANPTITEHGPVTITDGGNVVLDIRKSLIINDSFTCPLGASFEAIPSRLP